MKRLFAYILILSFVFPLPELYAQAVSRPVSRPVVLEDIEGASSLDDVGLAFINSYRVLELTDINAVKHYTLGLSKYIKSQVDSREIPFSLLRVLHEHLLRYLSDYDRFVGLETQTQGALVPVLESQLKYLTTLFRKPSELEPVVVINVDNPVREVNNPYSNKPVLSNLVSKLRSGSIPEPSAMDQLKIESRAYPNDIKSEVEFLLEVLEAYFKSTTVTREDIASLVKPTGTALDYDFIKASSWSSPDLTITKVLSDYRNNKVKPSANINLVSGIDVFERTNPAYTGFSTKVVERRADEIIGLRHIKPKHDTFMVSAQLYEHLYASAIQNAVSTYMSNEVLYSSYRASFNSEVRQNNVASLMCPSPESEEQGFPAKAFAVYKCKEFVKEAIAKELDKYNSGDYDNKHRSYDSLAREFNSQVIPELKRIRSDLKDRLAGQTNISIKADNTYWSEISSLASRYTSARLGISDESLRKKYFNDPVEIRGSISAGAAASYGRSDLLNIKDRIRVKEVSGTVTAEHISVAFNSTQQNIADFAKGFGKRYQEINYSYLAKRSPSNMTKVVIQRAEDTWNEANRYALDSIAELMAVSPKTAEGVFLEQYETGLLSEPYLRVLDSYFKNLNWSEGKQNTLAKMFGAVGLIGMVLAVIPGLQGFGVSFMFMGISTTAGATIGTIATVAIGISLSAGIVIASIDNSNLNRERNKVVQTISLNDYINSRALNDLDVAIRENVAHIIMNSVLLATIVGSHVWQAIKLAQQRELLKGLDNTKIRHKVSVDYYAKTDPNRNIISEGVLANPKNIGVGSPLSFNPQLQFVDPMFPNGAGSGGIKPLAEIHAPMPKFRGAKGATLDLGPYLVEQNSILTPKLPQPKISQPSTVPKSLERVPRVLEPELVINSAHQGLNTGRLIESVGRITGTQGAISPRPATKPVITTPIPATPALGHDNSVRNVGSDYDPRSGQPIQVTATNVSENINPNNPGNNFNSSNSNAPIIENEAVKEFLKKHPKKYRLARILAKKLTLKQAEIMNRSGGIEMIQGTDGCPYLCVGCCLGGDQNPGQRIRKMTWEELTYAIDSALEMEQLLKEALNIEIVLISKLRFFLYHNSDSMLHKFKAKDGSVKDSFDMFKYIHEKTGALVYISTAGWNPTNDNVIQKFIDFSKENPEIEAYEINLGVKFHIPQFINYVKKEMTKILASNEEFRKYQFDFDKYSNPQEAKRIYKELLLANLDKVLFNSPTFKTRVANIKTLIPLIEMNKAYVTFFEFELEEIPPDRMLELAPILPLLEQDIVRLVRRTMSSLTGNKKNINMFDWDFMINSVINDANHRMVIVLKIDGSIEFRGDGDAAVDVENIPELASFHNNPIFAKSSDNFGEHTPIDQIEDVEKIWHLPTSSGSSYKVSYIYKGKKYFGILKPVRNLNADDIKYRRKSKLKTYQNLDSPNYRNAEQAVYELDKYMGNGFVPQTFTYVKDGVAYTVQFWIEVLDKIDNSFVLPDDMEAFDFIVGNLDKMIMNLFRSEGVYYTKDNEAAFPFPVPTLQEYLEKMKEWKRKPVEQLILTEEMKVRINSLDPEKLKTLLSPYLKDPLHIERMIERLQYLKNIINNIEYLSPNEYLQRQSLRENKLLQANLSNEQKRQLIQDYINDLSIRYNSVSEIQNELKNIKISSNIEDVFKQIREIEEKYFYKQYVPAIKSNTSLRVDNIETIDDEENGRINVFGVVNGGIKRLLAIMDYTVVSENTIKCGYGYVLPELRDRGLFELMFKEAVAKKTKITTFTASLIKDNLSMFIVAMLKQLGHDTNNLSHQELENLFLRKIQELLREYPDTIIIINSDNKDVELFSQILDAVRETSAHKGVSKWGFKIKEIQLSPSDISNFIKRVVWTRPSGDLNGKELETPSTRQEYKELMELMSKEGASYLEKQLLRESILRSNNRSLFLAEVRQDYINDLKNEYRFSEDLLERLLRTDDINTFLEIVDEIVIKSSFKNIQYRPQKTPVTKLVVDEESLSFRFEREHVILWGSVNGGRKRPLSGIYYIESNDFIDIRLTYTVPELRGAGLGNLLFTKLLEGKPNIKHSQALLTLENYLSFRSSFLQELGLPNYAELELPKDVIKLVDANLVKNSDGIFEIKLSEADVSNLVQQALIKALLETPISKIHRANGFKLSRIKLKIFGGALSPTLYWTKANINETNFPTDEDVAVFEGYDLNENDVYSFSKRISKVDIEQLKSINEKTSIKLANLGIEPVAYRGSKMSYLENYLLFKKRELVLDKKIIVYVLKPDQVNLGKGAENPFELAIQHPAFNRYLEQLKNIDVKVLLDPSSELMGVAGYCDSDGAVIGVGFNTYWIDFIHEVEHIMFIHLVKTLRQIVNDLRYDKLPISNYKELILNYKSENPYWQVTKAMGPVYNANPGLINRLHKILVETYIPLNSMAMHEAVAVYRQIEYLNELGYNEYNSLFFLILKKYMLENQINSLHEEWELSGLKEAHQVFEYSSEQFDIFIKAVKELELIEQEIDKNGGNKIIRFTPSIFNSGLQREAVSLSDSEQQTILHLERLKAYIQMMVKKSGLSFKEGVIPALLEGVEDSDKGKLAEYKKYFTEDEDFQNFITGNIDKISNAKLKYYSNLALLRAMELTVQSFIIEAQLDVNADIKEDLLKRARYIKNRIESGQPIGFLNKDITDFSKLGPIVTYMHALPGIWDAIKDASNGVISDQELVIRISTNFFHNGPHAGYWKFFGEAILKDFIYYTQGGIDNPFGEGNRYPINTSIEGLVHTIFDRYDQGSVLGLIKLYEEVSVIPGRDKIEVAIDMLRNSVARTQVQLEYIYLVLKKLEKNDNVYSSILKKIVEVMILYTQKNMDFIDGNIFINSIDTPITEYLKTGGEIKRIYMLRPDGSFEEIANQTTISSDIYNKIYKGTIFYDPLRYLEQTVPWFKNLNQQEQDSL